MPKPSEESFGTLGKPDSSLDDDFELDELDEVSRKPHFLDYDNKPPAELVEQPHPRCWNGAGKEERPEKGAAEERKGGGEDVEERDGAPEKGENRVKGAGCERSPLYHRAGATAPEPLTGPHRNGTYELGMATTLNLLPAKKQAGVNGTRAGSTWPMKERMVAVPARRQEQPLSQPPYRGELGEVGPKMECVYSLLSMLGSTNVLEMSCKFLELSRNEEKCSALRRSGCIPLLVHIIHNEPNEIARRNARHALVNVVRCNLDEGSARRELKVLRLIDQLIDYTDLLKEQTGRADGTKDRPEGETILPNGVKDGTPGPDPERHPIQAIGTLAKISYDEEHRHAMCQFGALQTIASLIQLDHHVHGSASSDALKCVELRRYASMVLTNLTFGQGNNKMLLCSNRDFMRALVSQLGCPELVQVTASVLRNLSWRADTLTKQTLVEIETVTLLMEAAMRCTVENTLKSILSALWNLSNHCAQNRAKVCEVPGALEFLIDLLSYEAPSKTWSIVENAGGILRNVSSHVAQCEPYRRVLREKQCLKLLLDQLKSPSLTVVSNACGTLGNLSSENEEDQRFLREHGAIPMLRSLIYSKHNIISNGSRLALKNLQQQQRPAAVVPVVGVLHDPHAPDALWNGKDHLPGLNVRKQRAMEQELGCAFYRKQSEPGQGEEQHHHNHHHHHHHHHQHHADVDVASSPDPDPEPETPINYGLTEERLHQHSYDYQETDIDQLTDYSLRYAENQSDTEDEEKEEQEEEERAAVAYRHRVIAGTAGPGVNVLMPEDSVKCYYTEGTPQIISSATSMSDLRAVAGPQAAKPTDGEPETTDEPIAAASTSSATVVVAEGTPKEGMVGTIGGPVRKSNPIPIVRAALAGDDLGCNTPDKPFNYCEEGTPDFSRETSLSIIDLEERDMDVMQQQKQEKMEEADQVPLAPQQTQQQEQQHQQHLDRDQQQQQAQPLLKSPTTASIVIDPVSTSTPGGTVGKSVSFLNTGADETPLMFSRTSSMGSLSSAEPACTDDKSSIVSEFSRMASGVMSPSELPDSPTQTIPHSPHPQTKRPLLPKTSPPDDDDGGGGGAGDVIGGGGGGVGGGAVRGDGVGAFADTVSAFNVEHTPAHFSCATSLSNLSLDEKDEVIKHEKVQEEVQTEGPLQPPVLPNPADVVLLGMLNGPTATADGCPESDGDSDGGGEDDELLASCISIGMNSVVARSSAAKQKSAAFPTAASLTVTLPAHRRYDDNDGHDSDDSSNLSDNNDRLLEECILSGMPKPKQPAHPPMPLGGPVVKENPFKMMRTNHSMMAPANDELNPYHIEDSPCNFSTVSALSSLTMASESLATQKPLERMDSKKREVVPVVSSPSVESETDDTILDEAIAAGITGNRARSEMMEPREEASASGWNLPVDGRPTYDSPPENNQQDDEYKMLADCIREGMQSASHAEQPPRFIHPSISMSHPKLPKNVKTTPAAMSKVVGAIEASPGVGSRANHSRTGRPASAGSKPSPEHHSQSDTSGNTDSTCYSYKASLSSATDSNIEAEPCLGTTTGGAQPGQDRDRAVVGEATTHSTRRTVPIGCEPVNDEHAAGAGRQKKNTPEVTKAADQSVDKRLIKAVLKQPEDTKRTKRISLARSKIAKPVENNTQQSELVRYVPAHPIALLDFPIAAEIPIVQSTTEAELADNPKQAIGATIRTKTMERERLIVDIVASEPLIEDIVEPKALIEYIVEPATPATGKLASAKSSPTMKLQSSMHRGKLPAAVKPAQKAMSVNCTLTPAKSSAAMKPTQKAAPVSGTRTSAKSLTDIKSTAKAMSVTGKRTPAMLSAASTPTAKALSVTGKQPPVTLSAVIKPTAKETAAAGKQIKSTAKETVAIKPMGREAFAADLTPSIVDLEKQEAPSCKTIPRQGTFVLEKPMVSVHRPSSLDDAEDATVGPKGKSKIPVPKKQTEQNGESAKSARKSSHVAIKRAAGKKVPWK